MRTAILAIALAAAFPVAATHAQDDVPASPQIASTPDPGEEAQTTASGLSKRFRLGIDLLPVLAAKVETGTHGNNTSSDLDTTYGLCLSAGFRILAGLSAGVAPQVIFHLSGKDSAGYSTLDSETEYDLMARIAYMQAIGPKVAVYAELMPGFSIVTYDRITVGSHPPSAKGFVVGGGFGAAFDITDRFFINGGIGYQQGFQRSSGIIDTDVKTRFVRIVVGGGAKL